MERKQKEMVYSTVRNIEPLSLRSRSKVELELTPTPTKTSLKRSAYVGPSKLWTTVTPYVYDRFPDNIEERTQMIEKACEHVGLPRPSEVYVMENGVSPLIGVPNSGDFRLGETGFSERPRYHVVLEFDTPVRGPVTIGRGRFFGIGLMRSITEDDMR